MSDRSALLEKIKEKDEIEKKIAELSKLAVSNVNLVDTEGFPRNDLDVHTIRTHRNALAKLQTDHKRLMKEIEEGMLHYTPLRANSSKLEKSGEKPSVEKPKAKETEKKETEKKETKKKETEKKETEKKETEKKENDGQERKSVSNGEGVSMKPFYLVDQVYEDSPASQAGLKIGDKIIKFGGITYAKKSPEAIQKIISHSIGRKLPVSVLRVGEGVVDLHLVPQKWSGRGLVGAHLADI